MVTSLRRAAYLIANVCFILHAAAAASAATAATVAPPSETEHYIVLLNKAGFKHSPQSTSTASNNVHHRRLHEVKFREAAIQDHNDLLRQALGATEEIPALVHSYSSVVNGFSAMLTVEHANILKDHPEVMLVSKDRKFKPATTRIGSFLGLDKATGGIWGKTIGSDVIIGVVDTGIWPEDSSFNDTGYTPVPEKFLGACEKGQHFTKASCNKKLVGARYFGQGFNAYLAPSNLSEIAALCGDYLSPRDFIGHGSFVAAIAAGSVVPSTNIRGVEFGTAKGVAYGARIASYKVAWCNNAVESDIVRGVDTAVSDGVDVINVSLQEYSYSDKLNDTVDPMSVVSYLAMLAGVPCIFAGGNLGQYFPGAYNTIQKSSPWMFTVAGSTLDRVFVSKIILGNKAVYEGLSNLNPATAGAAAKKLLPLADSAKCGLPGQTTNASLCFPGALDPAKVKGKIILCQRGISARAEKEAVVQSLGAVGFILFNDVSDQVRSRAADFHVFPASFVDNSDGLAIKAYINSSASPVAYLTASEAKLGLEAPAVWSGSSAGPSAVSSNILKPDIIAPGDTIFSAWSQSPNNTFLPDGKPSEWSLQEGTSLSAAVATGAVALLKSLYPNWHPSMYYSAIATTATQTDNRKKPIQTFTGTNANPFQMGAGHINPNGAASPGLVYAIADSYGKFLCSADSSLQFTQLGIIQQAPNLCPGVAPGSFTRALDLNLPSITFYNVTEKSRTTNRTLTNVGPASTYHVRVSSPPGGFLKVSPTVLVFAKNQVLVYNVTLTKDKPTSKVGRNYNITSNPFLRGVASSEAYTFGSITWYDNKGHTVRSTVVLNIPG